MEHTLTIETKNDGDFELIKELAQRLGLHATETYKETKRLSKAESLELLDKIAGSWEGEETGDELNAMIRQSRYDKDVNL